MKNDAPIPFSAPMVRAMLEGSKTQTRIILDPKLQDAFAGKEEIVRRWPHQKVSLWGYRKFLWVRETWTDQGVEDGCIAYQADGDPPSHLAVKWKSRSCMQRWASRLTLEVKEVRIQRLQDITNEDAIAEGIYERHAVGDDPAHSTWTWDKTEFRYDTPAEAFKMLWTRLHGPESWTANPFVAAISFDVIKANIDSVLSNRSTGHDER